MVLDIRTTTSAPFVGAVAVQSRSLFQVTIDHTPDGLQQHHALCALRITTDAKASRTTIPDAFVRSARSATYPIALEPVAGAVRYRADPGPDAIGYDRARGPDIPTRADDADVIDHEGDGHPGGTVELKVPVFGTIEVYVAQYAHTRFSGQLTDSGGAAGLAEVVALDLRVLDASNVLFARSRPAAPVEDASRFELVPLATSRSCESLAQSWDGEGPGELPFG
jgi:hypothetical protein